MLNVLQDSHQEAVVAVEEAAVVVAEALVVVVDVAA